ncbi:peptide/nickel transport system permease protein [Virgibacillus subterraneus]|uniref:Peptide/nickel transport system permease protein n=1 Tax=Virgibacillus subterraneus TaxID=621109 RepID=A0A1H9G605_9BACI|nr:ABC transporter permease [Virgibacillus subterraneus]SEQ45440.1 peptide/nickel transport system permease protein [Virgibacillus subterraneus]
MLSYFIKRLLAVIPILVLTSIIVFAGLQLAPGDPLTHLIDPMEMTADFDREALEEEYGLNDPIYVQYFSWAGSLIQGELGYSLVNGAKISDVIFRRLPATFELAGAALFISSILGILLGLISSIKPNSSIDYFGQGFGVLGVSIPDFFLGICAIQIFAVTLGWFPVGGRLEYGTEGFLDRADHLIMPALILGFSLTAAVMRFTRGSMLDILNKDYIKTARSKGIPERVVYAKHALRNALMPVVLILMFRLPFLVGGTIVIERVFNWPGMGSMIIEAVTGNDYPVIMVTTLLVSYVILLASLLVDLITALLDPRVRFE